MSVGTLRIIGTPIGNREDITIRAIKTLFSVDVLLCEDTRVTGKLLDLIYNFQFFIINDLGLNKDHKPTLMRFDENVERLKSHQVIAWLKEGKQIGLVTDAGMPGVSDPGMYLVEKCYEADIPVEVIPGPSALTSAIALAGMPAPHVLFLGFLPKKEGKRSKLLSDLRGEMGGEHRLVILYESPYRLRQTLEAIRDHFDDPRIVAMSELTKIHQKVIRGKVSEVLGKLPETVKGEWVIGVTY